MTFNGATYYFLAEAIDHTFTRLPAQAGMPGVESTQAGVITLDLGVCTQQITINGYVNTESMGANDPTKANLVSAVLTWWKYGATPGDLPQLTLPGGDTYPVSIKMASFHIEGGLMDRWIFSIIFLVSVPVS